MSRWALLLLGLLVVVVPRSATPQATCGQEGCGGIGATGPTGPGGGPTGPTGDTGPAGPICGANTDVIFNNGGVCGFDPRFQWNDGQLTTNQLLATNTVVGSDLVATASVTAACGRIGNVNLGGDTPCGGTPGVASGTFQGEMQWAVVSPTLANGANNDVVVNTTTYVLLHGGGGAAAITGFDVTTWMLGATENGSYLIVYNQTGSSVTFAEDSGSSLAGNRLTMAGGADRVVANKHSATFVYDGVSTHWLEIAP